MHIPTSYEIDGLQIGKKLKISRNMINEIVSDIEGPIL